MSSRFCSSPRVIAHIKGGLGNQLFCYAIARSLANRCRVPLSINTYDGFRHDKYGRNCLLHHFSICAPEAGCWEAYRGTIGRWRRSVHRRYSASVPLSQRSVIQESATQVFQPELVEFRVQRPVYLMGYWQHEAYFADSADVLRKEFQLQSPEIAEAAKKTADIDPSADAVSIHCRSYGEVKNPMDRKRLEREYYLQAISLIRKRIPKAKFYCFSDNPIWAKTLLEPAINPNIDITYVEHAETNQTRITLLDFYLMQQCRHHIVANSTFSWWTAWLGEKTGSMIVSPGSGLLAAGSSFPERWLKVEV